MALYGNFLLDCMVSLPGRWALRVFNVMYTTCYYWSSLLGAFAELRKATVIFVMSVCSPAWNSAAPTGRIFVQLDIRRFLENLPTNSCLGKMWRIVDTLHEDLCQFIISCWILLGITNVSEKSCRENRNTHFMFSKILPKIVPFMK